MLEQKPEENTDEGDSDNAESETQPEEETTPEEDGTQEPEPDGGTVTKIAKAMLLGVLWVLLIVLLAVPAPAAQKKADPQAQGTEIPAGGHKRSRLLDFRGHGGADGKAGTAQRKRFHADAVRACKAALRRRLRDGAGRSHPPE